MLVKKTSTSEVSVAALSLHCKLPAVSGEIWTHWHMKVMHFRVANTS